MAISDVFSNQWLQLIFNGTAIPDIAQNASSPVTSLFFALHTANPGPGNLQNFAEAQYSGYTRIGVVRTSSGWAIDENTAILGNVVTFPEATAGSETLTHFSVGTDVSNYMIYSGPLNEDILIETGIAPQLNISLIIRQLPGNLSWDDMPGQWDDFPGQWDDA